MNEASKEDRQIFQEAMAQVEPLAKGSRSSRTAHSQDAPQAPRTEVRGRAIEVLDPTPINGQQVLAWRRSGLRDSDYYKLKTGRLRPYKEIDLHGLTIAEASTLISNTIAGVQMVGHHTLCLIHGKGQTTGTRKSRLKGLVDALLRLHPEVLGFHSLPRNTGAVLILLRKSPSR